MRIGIDCRTILNPESGEGAGVGHYTYHLVNNLLALDHENEYVLFFDSRMKDIKPFQRPNSTARYFPFSQYRRFLPFAYSHLLISAALTRERLDLFHAPANIIPLGYTKPSVVTVHDLAIYQNPAWFPSQVFSTRLLVPRSLARAKAVIAVSESTARDLRDVFSVPGEKITVVHEGVDIAGLTGQPVIDVQAKFHLPAEYVCFVGTLEPRKNLVRLIEAYADVRSRNAALSTIPLVLAGKKGWRAETVFKTIETLKLGEAVRYLGYVTRNEKVELIRNARAFVFPSSYEGFGLPVLEAFALNTPVLTSNVSSLPEIAGDAALLVDPEDKDALVKGLERIVFDEPLRTRLRSNGQAQAKKFTWTKAAQETIAVYRRIQSTKPPKASA